MPARSGQLVEWLYRLSLLAKGLLGLAQIAGSLVLLILPAATVPAALHWLTRSELTEDPADPISLALAHWALRLDPAATHFYGVYLLSHGALNLGVVVGLVLRIRYATEASLVVLACFVAYQSAEWLRTHDPALLLLTAIDLAVIALVVLERRGRRV
ncbi:MAG: DUF2127 domain-containing protein [Vannielia sp.]|uniref:DUF2127 domain-containing protein n=1 Tax=Rhodobacterales TaxID=204455 RepID=UPI0020943F74|nr:DUF2127 domain-containing protein [Oceanicola sp. 502str15]MCO6381633.1 DUF2127 domain-containing protein [Oceanicola sp. 502str15]